MKEITEEMANQLREPLPTEAVKQHPTKTYLSSIKAIYVVERLNKVFGIGKWTSKVEKESVNENGMVVVKLIFQIPEYGIYHECYGGNDNGGENSKNFDLGDAFKGATTDALTKICSFLEIGIDVFKGKTNGTPQPTDNKTPKDETIWLTQEQFDVALKSDAKGINAVLTKYGTKPFAMKKDFKTQLENKLLELVTK